MQTGQFVRHGSVALVLGLLLTSAGKVVADTYYIATDGNDDNSGTLARPLGTFNHAIRLAKAGDTIYVRGGTYMLSNSIEINKAGASGSPIKLWSYGTETPILDFSRIHAMPTRLSPAPATRCP